MEFGHLNDVSQVDFRLPADDPRSLAVLGGKRLPLALAQSIARVGLPIWAQKAWVGKLYPKGTPAKDFLKAYSLQFDSIELNPTHYAVPTPEGVHRWRDATPPEFRFCPKVPQEISHGMDSPETPRRLEHFFSIIQEFGPRLGIAFMQLPPQFGPDRLSWLKRLFTLCAPRSPLAIEFRHPGWFEEGKLIEPAFEMMTSFKLSTVITDVSGRRDVSHSSLTSSELIVRFIGNEGHPSDLTRLEDWSVRLARWIEQGVTDLHFFVHQPDNVLSPETASEFVKEMRKRTEVPGLRDWKRHDESDQLALI